MSKQEQHPSDQMEEEYANSPEVSPDEHASEASMDDNENSCSQPNLDEIRSAGL